MGGRGGAAHGHWAVECFACVSFATGASSLPPVGFVGGSCAAGQSAHTLGISKAGNQAGALAASGVCLQLAALAARECVQLSKSRPA
jgi:hypothetical protein